MELQPDEARKHVLPPLDLNQRYSVEEAAAYLRQSRAKTFADISAGRLNSITDGRRRYVPGKEIARASGAPGGES